MPITAFPVHSPTPYHPPLHQRSTAHPHIPFFNLSLAIYSFPKMAAHPQRSSPFEAALTQFKASLTADELADIEITSLADVHQAIGKIQTQQATEKRLRNLNRIKGFLEFMRQYEQVVKVFLNVSQTVAFVWVRARLQRANQVEVIWGSLRLGTFLIRIGPTIGTHQILTAGKTFTDAMCIRSLGLS